MAAKRPAPPPEKPTKVDVIRMRVTPEQKRVIVAAAEREGLEVSQWLRQLALRAAGALPVESKRRWLAALPTRGQSVNYAAVGGFFGRFRSWYAFHLSARIFSRKWVRGGLGKTSFFVR
jgi:hypothetical protein